MSSSQLDTWACKMIQYLEVLSPKMTNSFVCLGLFLILAWKTPWSWKNQARWSAYSQLVAGH